MDNRKRLRVAIFIPVLVALLACFAWAATSDGKGSHYPGQDCSACHKVRGRADGNAPAISAPAGSTTGTGSTGTQTGTTPSKGASQPR